MFRRRRIIRPIARMAMPVGVPAGGRGQVNPRVAQAHNLMEQGQYPEAAAAFTEIAEFARSRGGPRAPFFFIQAGRASVLAGQVEEGVAKVREGLELLAGAGRWAELQRVGQAVVDQLTEQGYPEQSKVIADWLAASLAGKVVAQKVAGGVAKKPVLPPRCPSCGALVNPKEVEWVDEITALCLFCGSPVRSE
ncbi:MAG: hypothetical protein WBV22_12090 [Anaerolineaceae bacterium]